MTLEPLKDGRLQITWVEPGKECESCDCEIQCGSSALLTVRGKDHTLTKAGLEAIARDLLKVASEMEEGPPGILAED